MTLAIVGMCKQKRTFMNMQTIMNRTKFRVLPSSEFSHCVKQIILLSFIVTNYNPDPDPGHLPHLKIYSPIYITLNKLWDWELLSFPSIHSLILALVNLAAKMLLVQWLWGFWKMHCVQSHHRKICGISSTVSVSWLVHRGFSFHYIFITSAEHQDLTIASQLHPVNNAFRFLLVSLNFGRGWGLVSAEYIVKRRFHEGSETGRKAN